jgi:hypothetical protein
VYDLGDQYEQKKLDIYRPLDLASLDKLAWPQYFYRCVGETVKVLPYPIIHETTREGITGVHSKINVRTDVQV